MEPVISSMRFSKRATETMLQLKLTNINKDFDTFMHLTELSKQCKSSFKNVYILYIYYTLD